jgi:hypothetical protein
MFDGAEVMSALVRACSIFSRSNHYKQTIIICMHSGDQWLGHSQVLAKGVAVCDTWET